MPVLSPATTESSQAPLSSQLHSEPESRDRDAYVTPSIGVIGAWLTSLVFHACVMVAMFLVVLPFSSDPEARETWSHAQVAGEIDAPPSSIVASALSVNTASTNPISTAVSDTANQQRTTEALRELAGRGNSPAPGADAGSGSGSGTGGFGGEGLPLIGIGGGGSGEPGEIGLPGGGPSGPEFFGVGGAAQGVRSVVYVVDRSASMVGTFHAVVAELKRSISSLRRSQKFHVIFFSGEPLEAPPGRLVNAVDAHKRQLFDFLGTIEPKGSTKPERPMRMALALQPDIVYFLSDGVFDPSLIQKLDEWNKQRKTRIFTIAYLDQSGREMLEIIARDHNGEFKYVTEDDLP